jgi:hypothetical protein
MTSLCTNKRPFKAASAAGRNQIGDVFNRPGLSAVDFTAAAKDNSSQLAVDATDATSRESELTAVGRPLSFDSIVPSAVSAR